MVDKDRVLNKIDELDSYLRELQSILPDRFEEYRRVEKKRSCERLLQLCIECLIDICKLCVAGLKLGLPAEENDLFEKMAKAEILSESMIQTLKDMRAFRNILIHDYAVIDDKIVFEKIGTKLADFVIIKNAILSYLRQK